MRLSMLYVVVVATMSVLLSACGGGGSGTVASAPPPVATDPAPTDGRPPKSFEMVPATIFAERLYNPDLKTLGGGFQHEYGSVSNMNTARNIRDAGELVISFDQASGNYLVSAPVAGSGTLMRSEEYPEDRLGFSAEPSNKNPTTYCCNTLSVSAADQPGSTYRYVSFVNLYASASTGSNTNTIAYGTWAVAQPTKPGEVPTTGSARYTGQLTGHFAGDAGATMLYGISRFDFDFARGMLAGDIVASIQCMMGCQYDTVTYALTDTQFARGSTTFSGGLATNGAPSTGSFAGLFAGPGASEMAAQFQVPFFNPELKGWVTATGAIAGKRD